MTKMLSLITISLLLGSQCSAQSNQQSNAPIQQSHIEAHVPAVQVFRAMLERDLLEYARASIDPSTTSVEYKLLREQPTQSGVAYPKYYAWIRVLAGSQVIREGATRIATINRTSFEVTDFFSSQQIKFSPDRISLTFPAPLVAGIFALAAK
ncbi:hypothetical protein [Tardiphaga sp.]|uniref:hypothetical protein n=1 Tax=Tardiphaga sp. TaxID=1926292 RepID=UPI00262D634D|nr:hypothetical protein [Tardiphaga sp.]